MLKILGSGGRGWLVGSRGLGRYRRGRGGVAEGSWRGRGGKFLRISSPPKGDRGWCACEGGASAPKKVLRIAHPREVVGSCGGGAHEACGRKKSRVAAARERGLHGDIGWFRHEEEISSDLLTQS
eukprot:4002359-Prymnesium_polylepis.1